MSGTINRIESLSSLEKLYSDYDSFPPVISHDEAVVSRDILASEGYELQAGISFLSPGKEFNLGLVVQLCKNTLPFEISNTANRSTILGPYVLGNTLFTQGVGLYVRSNED